jgi:hypothetical protein
VAEGASVDSANALLSALLQATSFAVGTPYLQLHVGAPGAAGTSNIATETRRIDATGCFGTTPSGGSITNDATIGPLTSVAATETYTHFTIWDDPTAGTFWFSGVLTGASVTLGDDFQLGAGKATVSQPVAS